VQDGAGNQGGAVGALFDARRTMPTRTCAPSFPGRGNRS
jgi:hypothetical protein